MADKKPAPDWEKIEADYRAGVLSIPEIAKRHGDGITHQAVYKKAKDKGWKRDLTKKVQNRTKQKLVEAAATIEVAVADPNVQPATKPTEPPTEEQIVEAAASEQTAVIKIHRTDIRNGRQIVALLSSQLLDAANCRGRLVEMIEADTTGEDGKIDTKRRGALLKAVSIPAHAGTIRDLSTALKNLIGLERQAFNIDENSGPQGEDGITGIKITYVRANHTED